MACLLVIAGPNEGDYYPLGQRTLVIGRQESCAIQLADDRVSRKHAQIRLDGPRRLLLDMNSTGGVRLNGNPIDLECELRDGAEVQIGGSTLLYSEQTFPDRASAFGHYKQRGQRARATLEPEPDPA